MVPYLASRNMPPLSGMAPDLQRAVMQVVESVGAAGLIKKQLQILAWSAQMIRTKQDD